MKISARNLIIYHKVNDKSDIREDLYIRSGAFPNCEQQPIRQIGIKKRYGKHTAFFLDTDMDWKVTEYDHIGISITFHFLDFNKETKTVKLGLDTPYMFNYPDSFFHGGKDDNIDKEQEELLKKYFAGAYSIDVDIEYYDLEIMV